LVAERKFVIVIFRFIPYNVQIPLIVVLVLIPIIWSLETVVKIEVSKRESNTLTIFSLGYPLALAVY